MWPKSMGRLEIQIIWCLCLQHLSHNHLCCCPGTSPKPLLPPWPLCVWNTLLIWLPLHCHHLLLLLPPSFSFMLCIAQASLSDWLLISVRASLFCSSIGKKMWWKSLAVEIISHGNHKVWPVKVCVGEEIAVFLCPVKSHLEKRVNWQSAGSELQTL